MDLFQNALVVSNVSREDQLADEGEIHREPNPVRVPGCLFWINGPAKDEGAAVHVKFFPDRQEFFGGGVFATVFGIIEEGSQSSEL